MNNKTPTGPEDIPLRNYIKSFQIIVSIYDLKTDKLIRQEQIDYGNYEHRKWLGKVTYYCCANGQSVETMSLEDYNKSK